MAAHLNKYILLLVFFACLLKGKGEAAEPLPAAMVLTGHLSKESILEAKKTLEKINLSRPQTLVIEINSSSGDLAQALELAKALYELKTLNRLKVIVYLNDNAVGPAAIIPFLADELYASLFVSWGDIPLGSENTIPSNLLRNRVRSLIDDQNPHASLLYVLADAMADPSFQVVNEGGWKIAKNAKETNQNAISAPGQTLVVNQNQLKEMGLIQAILPKKEFEERYHLINVEKASEGEASLQLSAQSVEEKLRQHIHFQTGEGNSIGYIYIGDHENAINQSTWLYVKQALDYYKTVKPIFIILELNTPGGEVFAAQKISDALKEMDTQYNIPIVAFINNWAISAGAMLAYSCRFIATVKDGSMGAAEPVYAGEGGKMETASEKVNSALRADFANRAAFFDRDPLIAEAMVDKDMILVLRHGKVVQLNNDNQIKLTGPDPDKVISPKGKLLTLNAEQMLEYGVADLMLPPQKIEAITGEEKASGRWPAKKMLLFQTPFFSKIPQTTVQAYQMDWKTHFFVFLATPLVSSLLFMGLIIGGYIELNNPGLSLPGSIAAICLFLIILSSFSLEIANWLELILLLTGIVLLLAELFVLPTFGLLGIVGLILFIAGLFGMLLPDIHSVSFEYDTKTLNAAGQYFMERLAWLCGSLILSMMIIAFLARYVLPAFSGFNRFVLAGHEQDAAKGFIAGESDQFLPQPGEAGTVLATLRPTGKILIKDKVYDAISAGGFIEAGEQVIVVRLEGSAIFVNRNVV
ncbi:NfeD family protein [Candidatus Protochlamydia phocaeensis]|uniref:NfeD family protein n=1 Tax=Candidatus Protochlamydia phocaeensis TaxID=1414722 RepID=UPI000837FC9F|nr:NfeD family protein [Candidatus Protochlamydia phocaeensis]